MTTFTKLFSGDALHQLWDGALSSIPTVPVDGTLLREDPGGQAHVVVAGHKKPAPPGLTGVVHLLWHGVLAQIPTG
jgi:hypothetical protein